MNKLLRIGFLGLVTAILLTACGGEPVDESASLGDIVTKGPSSSQCPQEFYEPVCADGLTYNTACDAEMDNKDEWTPGECE